jgi:hypothetical protein
MAEKRKSVSPFLKPNRRGPESEAEGVHLHVEEARRPVMAQLMNQDHDADHDQRPPNVL